MSEYSSPPAWLLTLLETVLNGILRLQEELFDAITTQLAGKQIQLKLQGLQWTFDIQIGPAGLHVTRADEAPADLTLCATPGAMLQLIQGHWVQGRGPQGPELEIHGDVQLAKQLQKLMQDWEIDWEEWLARAFGDIPAYHLSNMLRTGFDYAQQSAQTLQTDLGEYFQYEARALPDRHAVQVFLHEIDDLRDAVERLDARIARLQQALGQQALRQRTLGR